MIFYTCTNQRTRSLYHFYTNAQTQIFFFIYHKQSAPHSRMHLNQVVLLIYDSTTSHIMQFMLKTSEITLRINVFFLQLMSFYLVLYAFGMDVCVTLKLCIFFMYNLLLCFAFFFISFFKFFFFLIKFIVFVVWMDLVV